MLDEQISMGEQIGPFLLQPLFLAGGLRARTSPGSRGLLGPQTLPRAGHGAHHRLDDLGQDMKLAPLMRHRAKDLGVPVAGVQKMTIRTSTVKGEEENEGLLPYIQCGRNS